MIAAKKNDLVYRGYVLRNADGICRSRSRAAGASPTLLTNGVEEKEIAQTTGDLLEDRFYEGQMVAEDKAFQHLLLGKGTVIS
jgi:hypothetical protein